MPPSAAAAAAAAAAAGAPAVGVVAVAGAPAVGVVAVAGVAVEGVGDVMQVSKRRERRGHAIAQQERSLRVMGRPTRRPPTTATSRCCKRTGHSPQQINPGHGIGVAATCHKCWWPHGVAVLAIVVWLLHSILVWLFWP
eukprot:scaffold88480_cov18-Tisochrysis_lutea.AAC.3